MYMAWVFKLFESNDDLEDQPWISYRTIIFAGVLLFGVGYMLRGAADVIDETDDALTKNKD